MEKLNICDDKSVLEIIWNEKELNNQELSGILYRLCHAGDNSDSDMLRRYTHITDDVYDDKIIDILKYVCSYFDFAYEIYNSKYITKDDIKDKVEVLPEYRLIDFISGSVENYFVVIDYEDYDNVYNCDYLLEVLMNTTLNSLICNKDILSKDDIKNIIKFINNLDLFDIELFKLYNKK